MTEKLNDSDPGTGHWTSVQVKTHEHPERASFALTLEVPAIIIWLPCNMTGLS